MGCGEDCREPLWQLDPHTVKTETRGELDFQSLVDLHYGRCIDLP